MSKFTYVKPTICVDEVLFGLEKKGFDIINADGSLYDIKLGA